MRRTLLLALLPFLLFALDAQSAPPDRISRAVDKNRTRVLNGIARRLPEPAIDLGYTDPGMPLDYVILMAKPSTAQQSDLEQLLRDQQNPDSPRYHQWLTPEEFGERFGLSAGDQSRIRAWLASEGLSVKTTARSANWFAFSGSAAQVSKALHTSIHRFRSNGELHYAPLSDPGVPDALADVIGGFLGLDDFHPQSYARVASLNPEFSSGGSHYLAPADYATIYDIGPLYAAGIDG
ncbi:MAG: peptidase S8, partial [Acidobacteriia bacterium]|nr:peptidase S8 [Terriglobia bacterium]